MSSFHYVYILSTNVSLKSVRNFQLKKVLIFSLNVDVSLSFDLREIVNVYLATGFSNFESEVICIIIGRAGYITVLAGQNNYFL